jgi:hypothetical protein
MVFIVFRCEGKQRHRKFSEKEECPVERRLMILIVIGTQRDRDNGCRENNWRCE